MHQLFLFHYNIPCTLDSVIRKRIQLKNIIWNMNLLKEIFTKTSQEIVSRKNFSLKAIIGPDFFDEGNLY